MFSPPLVVLTAVDSVLAVQYDGLALHVPLAHLACEAPVMVELISDCKRVVWTDIFSTFCTILSRGQFL